jgi:uncharacterized protein
MELLIGGLAIIAGAAVQGALGFGIALVAVPVLVLTMPPTLVTPMMIILGLLNNLVVLAATWRDVRARLLVPLAAAGLLGLPIGVMLLKYLDAAPFKIGVGVLTMLLAVAMYTGWNVRVRNERAGLLVIGGIGGVLHSAAFISGPPVVLYLTNLGADKAAFRANAIAFFTVMNVFSIVLFSLYGLMTRQVVQLAAWYTLPLLAGSLGGVWLATHINQQLFTRAVLVLVGLLGLTLVLTNLSAILH